MQFIESIQTRQEKHLFSLSKPEDRETSVQDRISLNV